MIKIISQTAHGRVFKCPACSQIHFEFKNLNFNFSSKRDYNTFCDYFLRMDGEYWEAKNKDSYFKRRIIVPIGHKNFNILINNQELLELKALFSKKPRQIKVTTANFDCQFCEN